MDYSTGMKINFIHSLDANCIHELTSVLNIQSDEFDEDQVKMDEFRKSRESD